MNLKRGLFLSSFNWYTSHIGNKIYLVFFVSVVLGLLDGLGITMFIPLLENSAENNGKFENLGELNILIKGLQKVGISITTLNMLLLMAIFFILKGITKFFNSYLKIQFQKNFLERLRYDTIKKVSFLDYQFYLTNKTGRFQNLLTGEFERVQQSFLYFFTTIEQFLTLIIYVILALLVDPQFAILVSFGGLLTNYLYKRVYKKTEGSSNDFSQVTDMFYHHLNEYLQHYGYLKVTNIIHSYSKILKAKIQEIEATRKHIGILRSILDSAREPLLILVIVSVILFQIYILDGSLAAIILSLIFFYRALGVLTAMQNSWNYFLELSGSVKNIQEFRQILSQNQKSAIKGVSAGFKNGIHLEDVTYKIDSIYILKDISININKNETIAIIGESGSGKTTLVNLIAGLISPNSGNIRVDGKITENDWDKRLEVGFVTQDPIIFNDTLFNNITLWSEKNSQNYKRCEQVLEKVNALRFSLKLSKGLDTILGRNGVELSGGQKQRICIARELYKTTDLLVFDEATSALDDENEKLINQSIHSLHGQKTILWITHKLKHISAADKVIILKNGKLYKQGTYNELKLSDDLNF